MNIRHWPDGERPRERLIERGAHTLSDAELLAVLLGSGVRGQSAVELARTLIGEFGSLRELMNAERALLTGACRYQSVKSILKNSLDVLPVATNASVVPPSSHAYIRGSEYFN